MKPLVTVITITYNCLTAGRRESLIQCIESVKAQSYENIEHIIIDGASTDGTLDLIKSFEGLKIYSEPDKGVFDAFNKGVMKAAGKYVIFMNSDDYFQNTDAIKISVEALEKSGADYSYGDTWLLHEENPEKSAMRKPQLYKSFVKMPFCHQSMFCKTDVLKEIGLFDVNNKIASDYEVYLKLLLCGYKGVNVHTQIACFRCGGVSGNRKQFTIEAVAIFKNLYSRFYNLSDDEAYCIWELGSIPLPLVFRLAKFLPVIDRIKFILLQLRHFMFQIRTSRKNFTLKILGFYVVKPKLV